MVVGTRGYARIERFHHPTRAVIRTIMERDVFHDTVVEEPDVPMSEARDRGEFLYEQIHPGSQGFVHQVRGVLEAIEAGLLQCPDYTWADAEYVYSIIDEAREQIGVAYPQDAADSGVKKGHSNSWEGDSASVLPEQRQQQSQ